ncbi:3-dehydroquinate synthase [Panacagrimonas perspica]|uniref:3-dehydroquinate synthase n=1 Tax=Panacagrimonas perspica TaxID=381431 RepID=A0A4R7P427_9GAMM|nr:3-dehydroquinate synthase [Panacagrimonas perspica]TDU28192.1 3-dehydroquinate synthase [Panacagrimonas perspica]THD01281.1 3-dehydroquinate synthase [Panacagrimonas perspica]
MSTRILNLELGARSYPIRIGSGLLRDPVSYQLLRGRRAMLVTDENVAQHHLDSVLHALKLPRDQALVLKAGESQKSWEQAGEVLDWMLASRLSRDGALIALGGGVIGDLAGFCASLYQRGIDFVQLPTTLLAQVDSSVGGKTAVNHPRGKNLIGAFHQPIAVVADTDTLATLPPRELRAGLAEVIKYGLLADPILFGWLEKNLDRILALESQFIAETIERCCAIKARIVGLDERESVSGGPRALLNLGHTFGHAIETFTGYSEWLHGEAVAAGMCMAADLSHRMGWIKAVELERATRLLGRVGLPTSPPDGMTPEGFRDLMGLDKKVKGGKLRLVLLRSIGEAVLTADFDEGALHATLEKFCNAGPAHAFAVSI